MTVIACDKKHGKIDLALFGEDGRGGIVKDITDIKNFMDDSKTKSKESRALVFSIIGGAATGLLMIILQYLALTLVG